MNIRYTPNKNIFINIGYKAMMFIDIRGQLNVKNG